MTEYHATFDFEKYYHIYNRGNNKESLFLSNDNYRFFLSKWKKYISPFCEVLAYCLMPNHFHFLIKVKSENELLSSVNPESLTKPLSYSTKPPRISRGSVNLNKSFTNPERLSKAPEADINQYLESQFRNLFSSYTLAFNKQQNRTGSLFQKRFKRVQITSNHNITRLIHYIHHNPIHHGFVEDYYNWRYSSYQAIISNRNSAVNQVAVLEWYGGQTEFIKFHQENLIRPEFEGLEID